MTLIACVALVVLLAPAARVVVLRKQKGKAFRQTAGRGSWL